MDQFALDPYEQQLLKVFDSHDRERLGSLDRDGLIGLCQTLQLEEQGLELVKCLLTDNKKSRATFPEFKDALLALLGNMQNNTNNKNNISANSNSENTIEKTSPEREVSPKFVYGSKKYGRRSRPKNDENSCSTRLNFNNEELSKNQRESSAVQRSNSQIEVSSKKRKTNYKLKRCTSLPGNDTSPNNFITTNFPNETELICTEEMLREAWKNLGVGEDGYLNQAELVLVCDAIGLHKLADGVIRQLSEKLSQNTYNSSYKISFNELLDILRQDDTWFDVLNQSTNNNSGQNLLNKNNDTQQHRSSSEALFPDSRTFQYVTLGPNGNGSINTESLIEMWEAVGIHSPKELIHELGFNTRMINVVELAEVLYSQTKNILQENERGDEYQTPQFILLQANLSLYQSEIRSLKSILEQMQAEREKLKCDVVEANNRATLLAQEVDDNHTRMEQNTINQVKLLEQRHADLLKEVTLQYSKDKEQLSVINQSLEDKIALLEVETSKLKNDLVVSQKYAINLEKENNCLTAKIEELGKEKSVLTQQIGILENEKQNSTEIERREGEILLAKLSALQIENSKLKDHNDEMASEIECLNNQMLSMKSTKAQSTPTRSFNTLEQSMEENISIICEGVGLGGKRRSDYSPTKDTKLFNLADGSPRLGKLRKFHKPKIDNLEVPFTSSESGFDTEPESLSNSACDAHDEIARLQAKVIFLEQILVQNNIPVPDGEDDTKISDIMQLTARVRTLEMVIEETKRQMLHTSYNKDCENCERIRSIRTSLEHMLSITSAKDVDFEKTCVNENVHQSVQTEVAMLDFEKTVKRLETQNTELVSKCSELENCIELLRNEYEKCEDYWQSKVDEERQFFEAEQRISGEKLNEVLMKMKEYEEQYASQDIVDSRLPPIEETENLEKQFTDLEQEFEEYKSYHETELYKKDEEIAILKQKLTELALRQRHVAEAAVQVGGEDDETRMLEKMKGFTSYVIESTNRFSEEMVGPLNNVSTSSNNHIDFTNSWEQPSPKSDVDQSAGSSLSWNFPQQNNLQLQTNSLAPPAVPSTSSSQNSTPCRPKRTRKHDKNVYKRQISQEKEVKKTESNLNNVTAAPPIQPEWKPGFPTFKNEQSVVIPLAAFHNLNGRKNFLEQRVRHLQICLKQQHCHNEQTLQYYWQHFRGERADLHSKLKICQDKLDQQVRICNEQLEKLHRTDMLVKDLYVENSYLFAAVERLEKQCRLLTQCNNAGHNSTSSV